MVLHRDKILRSNYGSAEEAGLLLSNSADEDDYVSRGNRGKEVDMRGPFLGLKAKESHRGSRLSYVLALIVFVQTISTSRATVKTVPNTVEYLFDLTDNTRSAITMSSSDAKYESVYTAMTGVAEEIQAKYSNLTDGLSSNLYSYVEGVDYFKEKGYIYPYDVLSADDRDEWAYVRSQTTQKFNLDGYTGVPNIVMIMVDDVGWNDLNLGPLHSTMIRGKAFPAMDTLIKTGGITIDNYITAAYCTPARGQFLTGKYSSYILMDYADNQLPLTEATLAQELKTAGYHTMHVGKWGVGWDAPERVPMARGFDTSFGYYGNQAEKFKKVIDPNDVGKLTVAGYNGSMIDLWDDGVFVGDDKGYFAHDQIESYLPFILQKKGEAMLEAAAERKTSDGTVQPFFMYFASDLAHNPYVAPDYYLDRCGYHVSPYSMDDDDGYDAEEKLARCAMMLILDETIGNLTCKLESLGLADNTLIAFASDNGGDVPGDNYPYLGSKFYEVEGGIKTPAAVFGPLIPDHLRGTSYSNLFHVTDWLPTIMHVATGGAWTHSMLGEENELNGISHWDEMMGTAKEPYAVPRDHALTYTDSTGRISLLMYHGDKLYQYMKGLKTEETFEPDQAYSVGGTSHTSCEVSELSFAGSLPAVVSRLFLRTRTVIAGGSAAALASTEIGSMSQVLVLAMFVSLVALTMGSLFYRLHAARKDAPRSSMPSTRYGAFTDEDDDSLMGT